ncbi:MAG TPA: hypothetical protein DEX36_14515 [Glutamicibacter sp.]|jgi:hypothetical protein|nr:hypothetical protein [Glutamicibacter sp.]
MNAHREDEYQQGDFDVVALRRFDLMKVVALCRFALEHDTLYEVYAKRAVDYLHAESLVQYNSCVNHQDARDRLHRSLLDSPWPPIDK